MSEPAGFEAAIQQGADALLLWFRAHSENRWRQGAYETESGRKAAAQIAVLIQEGRLVRLINNDSVSYLATE